MVKVLIADELPRKVYGKLFRQAGIEFLDKLDPSKLEETIAYCEGLIVRSSTKVTEELISKAPKLKIVGRAGTGYDNIDINAATSQGIVVENTPNANSESAAEHTMALIYAISRNISSADASVKSGIWDKKKYSGTEIKGKILGIIGLGNIGKLVAEKAKGNGMEVSFFDPYVSDEQKRNLDYKPLTLNKLLKTSDYVTLHVPPTDETKWMIGKKELGLMKKTSYLLNVSLLVIGIMECIAVGWIFGAEKMRRYINRVSDSKLGEWWDVSIKYIIPLALGTIVALQLRAEFIENYGGYPDWAILIGWLFVLVPMAIAFLIPQKNGKVEA